jgi:hypothetical protein
MNFNLRRAPGSRAGGLTALAGVLALGGCWAGGGRLHVERGWARPAEIQAAPGARVCVDLAVRRPQPGETLVLRFEVLDAQGRAVPSAMPELADAGGRLVLRREAEMAPREAQPQRLCAFLPLEALPDPGAQYELRFAVFDGAGAVLGSGALDMPRPARAAAARQASEPAETAQAPDARDER